MSMVKRNGSAVPRIVLQVVVLIWVTVQVYPLFWLVASSFKPSADIARNVFDLPKSFYLGNYDFELYAQRGITIGTYFWNSILITALSLILIVVVSLPAAWAIAKLRLPGKAVMLMALIGLSGVPFQSVVIPLYGMVGDLGLLNNPFGLILPYVGLFCPFSILLMQAFFREIPDEILEAARMDGAGEFTLFRTIAVPLARGSIASVSIMNFIHVWNSFLLPLVFMRENDAKPLTVGLMNFRGPYDTEWGPMFAALVLVIAPSIAFFLVFHRYIIRGTTVGAVKG